MSNWWKVGLGYLAYRSLKSSQNAEPDYTPTIDYSTDYIAEPNISDLSDLPCMFGIKLLLATLSMVFTLMLINGRGPTSSLDIGIPAQILLSIIAFALGYYWGLRILIKAVLLTIGGSILYGVLYVLKHYIFNFN